MDSPTAAAPPQRAALTFIFVTVMLDMLAFGIIIPVLPHLIVQLIGDSIAKAAVWAGAFGALFISDHAPVPLPGAAFLLAAILLMIAAVLALRVTRNQPLVAAATIATPVAADLPCNDVSTTTLSNDPSEPTP